MTAKQRSRAWVLIAIAVIALVIGIAAAVLLLRPGHGEVPMTATLGPAETEPVTPSPSPIRLEDIAGLPTHITVTHEYTVLIDAEIVPVTLDSNGVLAPPTGKVGVYYSKADWNTIPGNLDAYRGIIVGHDVTGTGAKDTFYNLGEVAEGDRITLTYALESGGTTTADFEVAADPVSAPKSDVVQAKEYEYLWQPMKTPGRELSLLSCDLATAAPGQHAQNNWIVDAVRVK